MPSPEPTRLGTYELLEKLGHGGMAQVYRAERTAEAGFKKKVAIKRMLPQYRRNPSLLERFAAEARTNARLDHPNLVSVVDFGIEPEPYLVMEYVEGVTLASLLSRLVERGQPLEIAAALFIGAEAAQGLDHAHRKRDENGNPLGIVHRDVSPQNVLLSNEGSVKVSDFGLVKAADNVVQTGTGVPIGKISYMAPEQADHHEVDARADVFSLGIVIWEMLTLRTLMPPNDPIRASQMLMACEFPPPSRYRPETGPELDHIVMSCLTRDPAVRTPSAQQLGMQLRERLHDLAPGYGRDQLARLLSWVFPERGWAMDEPHNTAAQPSQQERLSIPQVPAAEAMQRASMAPPEPEASEVKTIADVAPATAFVPPVVPVAAQMTHPQARRPPSRSGVSPLLWVILFAGVGMVILAIGLTVLYLLITASSSPTEDTGEILTQPPAFTVTEPYRGATFTSNVEAALFVGPEARDHTPVHIELQALGAMPIVAVAPGHEPVVVTVEEQRGMIHDELRERQVVLHPTNHPSYAIYVDNPAPASIHIQATDETVGVAPGIVILDPQDYGGVPALELVPPSGRSQTLSTQSCRPDALCLLSGRAR